MGFFNLGSCAVQVRPYCVYLLWGYDNGSLDAYGSFRGFVTPDCGVDLAGPIFANVELDTDLVGIFRCDCVRQFQTLFHEVP